MKTIVQLRSVRAVFAGVHRLPFSKGRRVAYWRILETIYCRGDAPRGKRKLQRPPVCRPGAVVSSVFLRAVGVVPSLYL